MTGPTTLPPTLEDACARWPQRVAITDQRQALTYETLRRRVGALAAAYTRLGVKPGDRVVCQLPTCPEFLVALFAAWACGAVHVGADKDLTGSELAWLVGHTDAAAVVFGPRPGAPEPWAPVHAVRQAHPGAHVIAHGAAPNGTAHDSLERLVHAPERGSTLPSKAPFGADDPAVLFMTSGTTGRPKGVIETIPSLWAKMGFLADMFCPGSEDVHLMYLPLSHAYGMKLAVLGLLTGGRVVMLDRFTPAETLRLITSEQATVLPGTPAHFRLVLDNLDPVCHRVDSLRWVLASAAPLPPALARDIYARLGADVLYTYGCSEGFLTLTADRDEILRGSVGRHAFHGPEDTSPTGTLAILDPDNGSHLPTGEVGEIAFGASRSVRYWADPPVATDGWYHTGDLGRVDTDGCLYVLGRLKGLVNRGGMNVAPGEVEAVLVRHPRVADGAVVATPDAVLGEAICACVVPAAGDPPDLAELRDFLGETLARHKLPDELCLVEEIPRTKISKVDRGALQERVADTGPMRQRARAR